MVAQIARPAVGFGVLWRVVNYRMFLRVRACFDARTKNASLLARDAFYKGELVVECCASSSCCARFASEDSSLDGCTNLSKMLQKPRIFELHALLLRETFGVWSMAYGRLHLGFWR